MQSLTEKNEWTGILREHINFISPEISQSPIERKVYVRFLKLKNIESG